MSIKKERKHVQIDKVLLTGGSSPIPSLQDSLFTTLKSDMSPISNAPSIPTIGASLHAASLFPVRQDKSLPDLVLFELTPHSLVLDNHEGEA